MLLFVAVQLIIQIYIHLIIVLMAQ